MNNSELLKSARKKLDWTQQNLADYFKVGQQKIVSCWESENAPIPEKVLKMAKEALRMSKENAVERFKLKTKKKQKRIISRGEFNNHTNLSTQHGRVSKLEYSLEGNSTKNGGVSELLAKYPPDSMERAILDAYITFRNNSEREGKCFPVAKDFANGGFKEASQKEVLEYFGSLSNAKRLAGELRKCLSKGKSHEGTIRTFPSPSGKTEYFEENKGFSCPCCGKKWRGAENLYDTLKNLIADELDCLDTKANPIQRLKTVLFESPQCFCGGDIKPDFKSSFKSIVLSRLNKLDETRNTTEDCWKAIFGNQEEIRHKDKCDYCGDHKDYWKVTLDKSRVARFICDDCRA